jgi:hypothetical protein
MSEFNQSQNNDSQKIQNFSKLITTISGSLLVLVLVLLLINYFIPKTTPEKDQDIVNNSTDTNTIQTLEDDEIVIVEKDDQNYGVTFVYPKDFEWVEMSTGGSLLRKKGSGIPNTGNFGDGIFVKYKTVDPSLSLLDIAKREFAESFNICKMRAYECIDTNMEYEVLPVENGEMILIKNWYLNFGLAIVAKSNFHKDSYILIEPTREFPQLTKLITGIRFFNKQDKSINNVFTKTYTNKDYPKLKVNYPSDWQLLVKEGRNKYGFNSLELNFSKNSLVLRYNINDLSGSIGDRYVACTNNQNLFAKVGNGWFRIINEDKLSIYFNNVKTDVVLSESGLGSISGDSVSAEQETIQDAWVLFPAANQKYKACRFGNLMSTSAPNAPENLFTSKDKQALVSITLWGDVNDSQLLKEADAIVASTQL